MLIDHVGDPSCFNLLQRKEPSCFILALIGMERLFELLGDLILRITQVGQSAIAINMHLWAAPDAASSICVEVIVDSKAKLPKLSEPTLYALLHVHSAGNITLVNQLAGGAERGKLSTPASQASHAEAEWVPRHRMIQEAFDPITFSP